MQSQQLKRIRKIEEIKNHLRPRSECTTACNTLKNHETNLEQYYTVTHRIHQDVSELVRKIFNYKQAASEIGSTKADFEEATLKVEDYYRNVYIDNSSGGGIQQLGKPKKPWKPWKGKG
eukprot:4048321-Amphidinium_carterae.1